jgi:hypothetical protein
MKFWLKTLVLGALFLGLAVPALPVMAASQVFAQQYGFNAKGELQQPLMITFKIKEKTSIKAVVSPLDELHNMLLIAFPDGRDIFAANFAKGYDYALYKVELRDNGYQDLLVLSYGKHSTGRTLLKGVDIIGANDITGKITLLPVAGFKEVTLFNSPLQVKPNGTVVLFRDKLQSLVTISWDKTQRQFNVSGVE